MLRFRFRELRDERLSEGTGRQGGGLYRAAAFARLCVPEFSGDIAEVGPIRRSQGSRRLSLIHISIRRIHPLFTPGKGLELF